MNRFFENYYRFLSQQFSSTICQKIMNGFNSKRYTTFRVNTIKIDIENALNELKKEKVDFKKSSYINNSFYFTKIKEARALKLDSLIKGFIYLQSISSMIPAYLMEPKEGEVILDITAAPGSKTTLLAALSDNKATIYANEKDTIRFERLKYNINNLGVNAILINEKAEKLYQKLNFAFDKVLVDVPCSGEGRFLLDEPGTYYNWSEKEVNKYYNLQKKILDSALLTLKDGGICVYSTCTLNKIENEQVLSEVLKSYEVEQINKVEFLKTIPDVKIESLSLQKGEIKVYRILPSEFLEGFTISIFKKIRKVES